MDTAYQRETASNSVAAMVVKGREVSLQQGMNLIYYLIMQE